jgi:pyrroline-5-carboxylate reductase
MAASQKQKAAFTENIAILGGGNIGQAIARGLVEAGGLKSTQIFITRRHPKALREFAKRGFVVSADNAHAVKSCSTVILAVQPGQFIDLLSSIGDSLDPKRHLLLSTVTGVSIRQIAEHLERKVPIVRVMPNTAIAIGESMTCLAANGHEGRALKKAAALFGTVGEVLTIQEEQMTPATALCACGVAFFLRAVRAASQGGIQIGFAAEDALQLAAQTARGAASLLQKSNGLHAHPESEIDKVTTPRGCTIAGLNHMEHAGFSSAMIQGLVTATEIANSLFADRRDD